ncbi:MAG: STAS-like domain-containing protein [Bacteroidetes bacterium]|nr:STAS-like domain-containing protein [Bacteroidota bacterium]
MKLVISQVLKSKVAAFHSEGLAIFNLINKSFNQRNHIELSFEGLEKCATQFLNASIGKLYLLNDPAIVDSLIGFDYGTVHLLEEKIREVRDNAIHQKDYDGLLKNATI